MIVAVVVAVVSCNDSPPVEPDPEPIPVPEFDITFTVETGGVAKALLGDVEVQKAKEGDIVTVEAVAEAGYTFTGWTSPDVTFGSAITATATFTMPAANVNITVTFELVPPPPPTAYALNFKTAYEGGTVAVSVAGETMESGEMVDIGAEVTITATTIAGYKFTEWIGMELADKTSREAAFEMPARNVTLSAVFSELPNELYMFILPPPYMIQGQGRVEVYVDGVGPIADRDKFHPGQSVNVKSIPADGWRLKAIYVDAVRPYPTDGADLTFPMPDKVVRINDVIFEQIP